MDRHTHADCSNYNTSAYLEFSSIYKYVLGLQVEVLAVFKDQTTLNQNEVQNRCVGVQEDCLSETGGGLSRCCPHLDGTIPPGYEQDSCHTRHMHQL